MAAVSVTPLPPHTHQEQGQSRNARSGRFPARGFTGSDDHGPKVARLLWDGGPTHLSGVTQGLFFATVAKPVVSPAFF
jgi:hypothetical protein